MEENDLSHTVVVVAADHAQLAHACELAVSAGGPPVIVLAGTRDTLAEIGGAPAERIVFVERASDVPVEALAGDVAAAVADLHPALVLAPDRSADRILLGACAAALDAPMITGVDTIAVADGHPVITRVLCGGIATEDLTGDGALALLVDGGAALPPGEGVPVQEVPANPLGLTLSSESPAAHDHVELGSAAKVVAIGRGLRSGADMALVEDLAGALGAEVACSRPLAEGLDWLPRDRYIGVSGQDVTPGLYLALGISGQLQHTCGMRGSGTVVVVNTDESAPFFAECDYGIVGDLYAVVPALTRALAGATT